MPLGPITWDQGILLGQTTWSYYMDVLEGPITGPFSQAFLLGPLHKAYYLGAFPF